MKIRKSGWKSMIIARISADQAITDDPYATGGSDSIDFAHDAAPAWRLLQRDDCGRHRTSISGRTHDFA
jgi:hypothetical protein